MINYISNGIVRKIYLIVGSIKKIYMKMSSYFLTPYEPFGGDINVKVDLSNYTTKAGLKNAICVNKSK